MRNARHGDVVKQAMVLLFMGLLSAVAGPLAAAQLSGPPPADTDQARQRAATLVVRGTIQAYDPTSKVLAITTSTATLKFTIGPDVRLREHWRPIDAAALEKLSGHRAALRYVESGDVKSVRSVIVFGKDEERQ
jgi:hypothetical protein